MSGRNPTDLSGMRFGRLTAVEPLYRRRNITIWKCLCDCGNEKTVQSNNLLNRHTQSCGCLQKERAAETYKTHGLTKTRLYRTWRHMVERCTSQNSKQYANYGGRGITVCNNWMKFPRFLEWAMSSGYTDDLTIERIDNNRGYSPENCRWATPFEQASNKRSNHTFTIGGVTDTMTNWARKFGIKPNTVFCRLHKGWSEYEALTTPIGGKRCKSLE